jgi:tetratricopeptide (TPR) repeat protein
VNFVEAVAYVDSGASDVEALDDLARAAIEEGEEDAALRRLLPAAERSGSALLWQWAGLLQRSIDEHEAAIKSFASAARIAPNDAGIAHGQARVALEAGLDAVELFLRARSLAPDNGEIEAGLAAARNAIGEGELAINELRALLERAPAWTAGYEQLAQLLSILGQKDRATEALEQSIAIFPQQESLWATLFAIDIKRADYTALARDIERAAGAGIGPFALDPYRAIAAAELEDEVFPAVLFGTGVGDDFAIWRIRHLLRVGAVEEALPIIDQELASDRAWSVWPYAATAWRLTGDDRSRWLEGDPRLVQVVDLTAEIAPISELAAILNRLHESSGEYLDQSVRGGSQTDGPLLSRIDPAIRRLRGAIARAVEAYLAQLPETDPRHPLLAPRRDRRIRFSGSWSVKLRGQGRHANHVHPQGWISSALYIELPPKAQAGRTNSGWLTLGQPPEELGIDVQPRREIEPKIGQLVLFPSWIWHGTVPFEAGERLTVAFDVRPSV